MVDHSNNGLLELLEGKLDVLRFQMKIKEELERIASRVETLGTGDTSPSNDPFPTRNIVAEDTLAQNAKEKATEISLEIKSITQLYNEYAVPFELWEVISVLSCSM
jgi:nuclear pore complex protein Nup155